MKLLLKTFIVLVGILASTNAYALTCYSDWDGDAYGDLTSATVTQGTCYDLGGGWIEYGGDCDDNDYRIHPEANDIVGDGIDQNCDSYDACYVDADDDGYASDSMAVVNETLSCSDTGYSDGSALGDCNDGDNSIYPHASEIYYDGIDQNCDGADAADADGDGFDSDIVGGTDCDDSNPSINPNMIEIVGNGIDDNCNGMADDVTGSSDSDADGYSDLEEGYPSVDTDSDGTPDYLDADSDNDTVADIDELNADSDNNGDVNRIDPDDDGDGIFTNIEEDTGGSDTDGDGLADYLDLDSDNDGLADEEEDVNGDGTVGPNETDRVNRDTDSDGLLDGIETGNGGDYDPTSTTNPLDDDTDNDGVLDGNEDVNQNGNVDGGETDPNLIDSDIDGLQDGLELGLNTPQGSDTDFNIFIPDADISTVTDPLNEDTDGDGMLDGVEDANSNGQVDSGETDPNLAGNPPPPPPPETDTCLDDIATATALERDYQTILRQVKRNCTHKNRDTSQCSSALNELTATSNALNEATTIVSENCNQ
ncbi:MSCRAMM family adhesin SdrC [Vibrio lamellibrachiae]|uniref:MopE-related protein n=1 Tax=Vibrio lamellibrachiae TaxID=2910253 RepID=UPI003D0FDA68